MDERIKNKISKRQECNLQIVDMLRQYCEKYPDIRFGQALANLGIIEYDRTKLTPEVIDPFFEEPVDVLERALRHFKFIEK